MKIKNAITEASSFGRDGTFGGETIDARDLPDKMQRKVSSIVSDMGLRSYSIEDDLKGKWIFIVFKKGSSQFDLGKLSNANQAGADLLLIKGRDHALAVRQR
jgi:hypothetical protein